MHYYYSILIHLINCNEFNNNTNGADIKAFDDLGDLGQCVTGVDELSVNNVFINSSLQFNDLTAGLIYNHPNSTDRTPSNILGNVVLNNCFSVGGLNAVCPVRTPYSNGMGSSSISVSLNDINNEFDINKKRALENQFIRQLLRDEKINQAMDMIYFREDRESILDMAGTYMQNRFYPESRTKIGQVTGNTPKDVEARNFYTLLSYSLENNDGDVCLSVTEETYVRGQSVSTIPVKDNAQALLKELKLEEYRRIPKKYGSTAMRTPDNGNGQSENNELYEEEKKYEIITEEEVHELKAVPNPFTNSTVIILPEKREATTTLNIIDMYGKLVKNYVVNNDNTSIVLQNTDLGNAGMYYIIYQSGSILKKEKLILIK